MPYLLYSYRFKRKVPLLDEVQWQTIAPLLNNRISEIKAFRKETGVSLGTALENDPGGEKALLAYFKLSGLRLDYPNDLYALRMSNYGRLCAACDKPFRTPRATFCAECGHELKKGTIAGPIEIESIGHLAVNQQLYSVFHKGVLLGRSRLEYGDAPMGVAQGQFTPSEVFFGFRYYFPPTEQQDQRMWEGFEVCSANGLRLECEAGISIVEHGSPDNPVDIEVLCLGVVKPEYAELFPHHVAAYEASFE